MTFFQFGELIDIRSSFCFRVALPGAGESEADKVVKQSRLGALTQRRVVLTVAFIVGIIVAFSVVALSRFRRCLRKESAAECEQTACVRVQLVRPGRRASGCPMRGQISALPAPQHVAVLLDGVTRGDATAAVRFLKKVCARFALRFRLGAATSAAIALILSRSPVFRSLVPFPVAGQRLDAMSLKIN